MFDGHCPPGCPCGGSEGKVVKHIYEGKVVKDPHGFNGGPNVMIEGTSRDGDWPAGTKASGTYHGRFLISDEHIGKRIRITIEVEE